MDFWTFLKGLAASRVTRWATNSDQMPTHMDDRTDATLFEDANAVSSLRKFKRLLPQQHVEYTGMKQHAVVLDLDIPAWLVPSSTPGHSHLYIDAAIPEPIYFRLLDVLVEARVIDFGYAEASKAKGASYARLPWVRKGDL